MFAEVGAPHHRPHFHAYYQDNVAVYSIDEEVHTLVWPNGADFDPATLHDWPDLLPKLQEMATRWGEIATKI
ncbi:MAG: DUF4160 domain-containing protein [Candidatus Latescibacteria bacterium]|nr:DUF4160 domain-containing protein [Candidatus Latescibacterota bacterium]